MGEPMPILGLVPPAVLANIAGVTRLGSYLDVFKFRPRLAWRDQFDDEQWLPKGTVRTAESKSRLRDPSKCPSQLLKA